MKTSEINKNLIEYRIFIALYSRFLIENSIIELLNLNINSMNITSNQTRALINILDVRINQNIFLKDLKDNIEYLYSYIPRYMHTNYNEIAYLIGLDINNLIDGIERINKLLHLIKTNK